MKQASIVRRRRATLGTGSGAHFVHDGFSDSLYVLFPIWAEALGLSHAQVGILKMVFSGAMAAFQVPAGFLAERWGERILLAGGTAVAGLGFILIGGADGFLAILLCLLVTGLASGVQHPLASTVISRAYETGPRRAALGAYNFAGDLGKVTVPVVVAAGIATIGWRDSATAYGLVGVVAGLAIFLALRHLRAGGPHFKFTDGFSLFVDGEDQEEVDEYWNKLVGAGANPSQCGWITDQFGISWQIVPRRFMELISDKNPKKVQAVMDAMIKMVKLDVAALEKAYNDA